MPHTVAPYAGDYRGRAPHVPLTLVHSETTGALSPESLKSIAHLDKLANKPAHRDRWHSVRLTQGRHSLLPSPPHFRDLLRHSLR